MPDRRQTKCPTAAEIAQEKIASMQVREGGPSREDVLREILVQLQGQFGVEAKQAASTTGEDAKSSIGEAQGLSEVEPLDERLIEPLDERLRACLEQLRGDFYGRGIVRIDEKGTAETYRAALQADKTAGKEWGIDIESRLLANDAALLKKAAAMPEGPFLVGVYENDELAIRQRSREIMNARWTEDWEDEDEESARGELLLLPHAEAKALSRGRWAKAGEIVRKVREDGYHLPRVSSDYVTEGLIAASEAVFGSYVRSPDMGLDLEELRSAILECDENVSDDAVVRVMCFFPAYRYRNACIVPQNAGHRSGISGAVIWLRG